MSTMTFTDALIAQGQSKENVATPQLACSSRLKALQNAGTLHIYADTADTQELSGLLATDHGAIWEEVDGNTVNQPLVKKVLAKYLDEGDLLHLVEELRSFQKGRPLQDLLPLVYAIICGRIGNAFSRCFASGRPWEVSLQLHMRLMEDPIAALEVGRDLRRMVTSAFVKVPFTPHLPSCMFVARDLEREGIPVNFTSTFSARQVVMGAFMANVSRTNIFMGRLDQGLEADFLGAHVSLEAQRQLLDLRGKKEIKTQLIVASMRQAKSFFDTAGCDAYTAPCETIQEFLDQMGGLIDQTGGLTVDIPSQVETSYQERLGISSTILTKLGPQRIARLYQVECEFLEFLSEYCKTKEYARLYDADVLVSRFEQAGFKDVFYTPTSVEWEEIRRRKTPDPDASITSEISLDTLYTLMADADFEKHQAEMDRMIEEKISQ